MTFRAETMTLASLHASRRTPIGSAARARSNSNNAAQNAASNAGGTHCLPLRPRNPPLRLMPLRFSKPGG